MPSQSMILIVHMLEMLFGFVFLSASINLMVKHTADLAASSDLFRFGLSCLLLVMSYERRLLIEGRCTPLS